MNDVAQPVKSVSSKLLLSVFMLIGLAIIVLSVRKFEADLAAANAAAEAEYAAEYAVEPAPAEEAAPALEAVPAE